MHSFKKVAAALVISGLLAAPAAASAQTSTTSIQTLLDQIKSLQAQIQTAQQQQYVVMGELMVSLKQGNRGENVKLLQQLLAQDKSIYPEGTISGFFGKLTAQAVKRFQKKHGIEQAGNVGPKTLKKLNEIFGKKNQGSHGSDDNDAASTTPGIGKVTICHKGKQTIYVGLPALQAHVGHGDTMGTCSSTATTTPDTTIPAISGISVGSVATTTATIMWNTNETATGKVYFGTVNPLVLGSATTQATTTLSTAHSFTLTGLSASTTYFYVVESKDASNNTAVSAQASFTTTQ